MVRQAFRLCRTRHSSYLGPCAGRFLVVNTIDTQVSDPINSGLTPWRLAVWMDANAEGKRNERNPCENTRFSLGVENDRADTGRDDRTCLARPNSQARTGVEKNYLLCSADHEHDWRPYQPVDAQTTTTSVCHGYKCMHMYSLQLQGNVRINKKKHKKLRAVLWGREGENKSCQNHRSGI